MQTEPTLFTPDLLLGMAVTAEAQAALGQNVYEHRRAANAAILCAAWMEKRGIASLSCVGPFGTRPQRGQKVRIKAGAHVHSTCHKLNRVNARPYTVTVFDCYEGYAGPDYSTGDEKVRNPEVHWAGSSGYWCWTSIENVEFVG